MRIVDHVPGEYHYALGDATNAYSRSKLCCFTRELVYIPGEKGMVFKDSRLLTEQRRRKCST